MTKDTHSEDPRSELRMTPSLSIQQLGFMGALPSDIALEIFSHLSQHECLTCMAVCRDWYKVVPQYVQRTWTTVHFHQNDNIAENSRPLRCLGNHVKNITLEKFKEQDLYSIMQMLVEWECTKIQSLELIECTTPWEQDELLSILPKLAPRLTQLKVLRHDSNIAFLHVLDACQALSHFTFSSGVRALRRENLYDQESFVDTMLSTAQFTHVTYLCLDVMLHKELRLEPILERCPNLRWFIGASKDIKQTYETPYPTIAVDLDSLLNWCPKLICFQNHYSYDTRKDMFEYTSTDTEGIQYLSQCHDYGLDQVSLQLSNSQDTLRHLSLRKYSPYYDFIDWSPVFRSLRLPRLQSLYICDDIRYDLAALSTFLNNCPDIEKLCLDCNILLFDEHAFQSLRTMHQLRYLELFECFDLNDYSLLALLAQLPALEHIKIDSSPLSLARLDTCPDPHLTQLKQLDFARITFSDTGDFDEVKDNVVSQFIRLFTIHSKIETIHLSAVSTIGSKSLEVIASTPTLRIFKVQIDDTLAIESQQAGVCCFAKMLQQTMIERLDLCNFQYLPHDALEALGNLPYLTEIQTSAKPVVSDTSYTIVDLEGLLRMLRTSTSLQNILFRAILIENSDPMPPYDNVATFIEQEIPSYKATITRQRAYALTEERILGELFIKRLV